MIINALARQAAAGLRRRHERARLDPRRGPLRGDRCCARAGRSRARSTTSAAARSGRTSTIVRRASSRLLGKPESLIQLRQDRPGPRPALRDRPDARPRRELGWEPAHTFEEGCAETVRWYVENRAWWRAHHLGRLPAATTNASTAAGSPGELGDARSASPERTGSSARRLCALLARAGPRGARALPRSRAARPRRRAPLRRAATSPTAGVRSRCSTEAPPRADRPPGVDDRRRRAASGIRIAAWRGERRRPRAPGARRPRARVRTWSTSRPTTSSTASAAPTPRTTSRTRSASTRARSSRGRRRSARSRPTWSIARTAVVYGWPPAAKLNFGAWLS